MVGGALQSTGRSAAAKVCSTNFTDRADVLAIDISSAYPCPAVERLERQFTYSRLAPSFTVSDNAEFSSPVGFESPFVTYCDVRELAKGAYELTEPKSGRKMLLGISVMGDDWCLERVRIENPGRPTVSRYAVRFLKPVRKASVVFNWKPLD